VACAVSASLLASTKANVPANLQEYTVAHCVVAALAEIPVKTRQVTGFMRDYFKFNLY